MENIIYDKNITDFSSYSNILLIDAQIYDSDLFYSSANSNTFPIKFKILSKVNLDNNKHNILNNTESDLFGVEEIYNYDSDKEIIYNIEDINNSLDVEKIYNSDIDFEINYNMEEVKKNINPLNQTNQLDVEDIFTDDLINELEQYNKFTQKQQITKLLELNNFVNLKRICIICDDLNITNNKIFFDSEPFFTKDDLEQNKTTYSENLQFIIDLCEYYNISNLDYLVCNSLKYDNWIRYYDIMFSITGVKIGASNDQTGNYESGGDWIMENTNENIKSIYFSNLINSYNSTLITHQELFNSSSNIINLPSNIMNLSTNIINSFTNIINNKIFVTTYYLLKTSEGKKIKFTLKENDSSKINFYYKILKFPKKGKIIKFNKKNGEINYKTPNITGKFYLKYTCVENNYGHRVSSVYKIKIIVSDKKNNKK